MALATQKYRNPIRTVSGTPSIYPSDVVLMCTTAAAIVIINLDTIPANYWNTNWKLYVVDASNNAGTYNITINAPAGYKINGASSAVINTNGGSAVVTIVSNTNFIATMSSYSGTNTPLPYFYAQKLMQNGATTYFTQDSSVYSILSGQTVSAYGTPVTSNLTGFVAATGIWNVQTSGYYSLSAKMVTRLLDGNINSLVDGSGVGWMSSGVGYMALGIMKFGGGAASELICNEKQAVVVDLVSDINIECTADLFYLAAGTTVKVVVLNKTNHNILGMASTPTCYIDFSAIKIS